MGQLASRLPFARYVTSSLSTSPSPALSSTPVDFKFRESRDRHFPRSSSCSPAPLHAVPFCCSRDRLPPPGLIQESQLKFEPLKGEVSGSVSPCPLRRCLSVYLQDRSLRPSSLDSALLREGEPVGFDARKSPESV